VLGVYLSDSEDDGNTATVVVPEDQLSLAIGRDGQNARLAAKLTGWRIDIKSQVEAAEDALTKLREDPKYQSMADREAEVMEKVAVMLEKKAEGRPLPPEDYDIMAKFIDRVEKRVEKKRREEDLEEKRRYEEALATVPPLTFEISILDVDLKEHILIILQGGGIETLGDLVLQMRLDSDKILALNGVGPKAFEEITELTDALRVSPEEQVEKGEPTEMPEEALATTKEVAKVDAPEVEEPLDESPVEVVVDEKPGEKVEQETPVVAPAPEPEKAPSEEEDEFDKMFSYDARKYGYYAPEKAKEDVDEEKALQPSKKKKRKKPRPIVDEPDEWEEW
jgi:N utilization substance protein A